MKLRLPPGIRLTLNGVVRQRNCGFVLEMPDIDFKTNQPVTRNFPLTGHDLAIQTQLQAHVDQEVTLWGVWRTEGARDESADAGFLQVTVVTQQEDKQEN